MAFLPSSKLLMSVWGLLNGREQIRGVLPLILLKLLVSSIQGHVLWSYLGMAFLIHAVNANLDSIPLCGKDSIYSFPWFNNYLLNTYDMWGTVPGARFSWDPKGHKRCPREAEIFREEWVSDPGGTGREKALAPLLGSDGFPCLLSLAALKWPCARKSALFFLFSRIKVTKPAFPCNLESHPPCTCTRSCITLVVGDSASVSQHFLTSVPIALELSNWLRSFLLYFI